MKSVNPAGFSTNMVDQWAAAKGLVPKNRDVAALGDSRSNQCTGGDGIRNMGYLHWLRLLCNQRFNFKFDTSLGAYATQPADGTGTPNPVHDNYGVGGNRTDQMLDRCDKVLANTAAGTFILFAGINDRPAGLTYAQSVANMTKILDKMQAAGRVVVLIAEMGTGNAAFPTDRFASTQMVRDHVRYRQWLLDQRSRPGVYVVDIWPDFADNTSTSNSLIDVRGGVCYDGRHPQQRGAFLIAKRLQPVFERLFDPLPVLPASNADLFDPINMPSGCLNANPMLAGTGGLLGTGSSGALAASWQSAGGSGSAGATSTLSKTVDTFGNPNQRAIIAGTPTGQQGTCYFDLLRTPSFHASIAPGDVLEAVCGISVGAGSTGILRLSLELFVNTAGAGTAKIASLFDGGQFAAGQYIPATSYAGILRTPKLLIPSVAYGNAQIALTAVMEPGVAANLDVSISAMGVRKIA